MKILIADKFQEAYLNDLYNLGHDVTLEPSLKAEELFNKIQGYDVLIVRSTKVTKEAINASDKLNLIIRAGAGVNTIDVDTAAKKGIFVCNTPGKNSVAVAELAMGLMLAIDRNIPDNVIDLKNGKWNKKKYTKADGIYGKTLGIIGLGDIGLEFAKRAVAFGMKVISYDPIAEQRMPPKVHNAIEQGILSFSSTREEMLKNADVVTIHVPSNQYTQNMVNKDFLDLMKPNSTLINTSRGNIVVDEDLIDAMDKKGIKVGLDVYNNECATATGDFKTALSIHPNVIGTHHIGASTEQAQNAIAEEVIRVMENFDKGHILHPVNVELKPASIYTLALRIYNKVGTLGNVLCRLKENGINVDQLETQLFNGENTQYVTILLDTKPTDEVLADINILENVVQADLKIKKKL
jgi:D-3-phosphoglycerate dehydrogenase / 2-oxoglutarate reductase